ncbi:MAG TPA: hypothetical protein VM146_05735 [Steroidobacteraceae bacterium]|nr:hypothetical protein [Steroidobacteraceae bacterium]
MGNLATVKPHEQRLLIEGFDLERQLKVAERRYAEARSSADKAREEWRALTVLAGAKAEAISAARERFEAVAARCNRLRSVIEGLEERLDY